MSKKNIETIIAPPHPHMVGDGFRVHTFIPSQYPVTMERMSPFLMMDYNAKFYFPPSDKPRGVSVHPHKGFETVTIAYKGKIAHHDSAGNRGIIGEGDVQWMTAGSGILHKEYHETEFSKQGGDFHMVQLWVNLPAKDKNVLPKYQEVLNSEMGKVFLPNDGGIIEVIAGEYEGIKGKATTFSPVHLMNAKLKAGAVVPFNFPNHFNTALVIIEGSVKVNERDVAANHFVLLDHQGENFTIEATSDAIVLVLSGEPILEPIAAHGPFVMNTRAELIKAFEEYQKGKFGYLEE
jgi:quercetin 2,3-dioxygenase